MLKTVLEICSLRRHGDLSTRGVRRAAYSELRKLLVPVKSHEPFIVTRALVGRDELDPLMLLFLFHPIAPSGPGHCMNRPSHQRGPCRRGGKRESATTSKPPNASSMPSYSKCRGNEAMEVDEIGARATHPDIVMVPALMIASIRAPDFRPRQ